MKGKTLVQLKEAKVCADNVSKNIGECIQEIEERVIFEEALPDQFKRIFGCEMPSSRMSVEQYYEIIVPVLKRMTRDNQQFYYEHYGGLVPVGYKYKYYF